MVYSVVDLGSNTIRLCIYEYSDNKLENLLDKKTTAGLVNYVTKGILSEEGMDIAVTVLQEYKTVLENFHISEDSIHVFATASLRNIKNTEKAVSYISEKSGLAIDLLSGEEEASLGFLGATKPMEVSDGMLIDIGGGSTELAIYKNREVVSAYSMPVGSLNMYVRHVEKIIPRQEERKKIRQDVISQLHELGLERAVYPCICGIGGTVRSAAKLNRSLYGIQEKDEIRSEQIKEILKTLNNNKRTSVAPILRNIPERIHTIIPGMIILHTITAYFHCDKIVVSKFGIREGYLFGRVIKEKKADEA